MSLRTFHVVFVLGVLIASEMFGAWAIWRHGQSADPMLLAAGILSFALGFGVIAYAIWFVRKAERAHLE